MELRIITRTGELREIETGWINLLQYPCNTKIHQRYDWFVAGYQTFHQSDKLYVLAAIDDMGKLSGVAPLVITPGKYRGINVKKIGFAKNDQSPANDFILSEGLEEDCIKMFLAHLTLFLEWELVDLRKLSAEGLTGPHLQKLLSGRGHAFGVKENIQSPYIKVDVEWEDFWKSRSQRFRKSMRNKINRAMKHEDLTIEKIPVTSAKVPELNEILRISANSWKHEIGNDLSTRGDNWNFYNVICDLFGPRGLLYVWLLKLDGVPAAFEFHVQYNNVAYPIRADYDRYYKDISPGSILEYEIIKRLFFDKDVMEYNSCGHTYDYLMNWTDATRKHQNIEIFDNTLKMAMLYKFEYNTLVMLRKSRFYSLINKLRATC